jgi:site-specific recombinase XerD
MLRTLFPKYYPRYERSCCADELINIARWLLDAGYSPKNTRGHLRRFRSVFELANQSAAGSMFTSEQLVALFSAEKGLAWRAISNSSTRRVYERFLLSENRLIQIKQSSSLCIACLDDYEQFLEDVRGFTGSTISQHRATVSEFLIQSLQPTQPVADLTSNHVERYIAIKSTLITRHTLQHIIARLRAFLRYGFELRMIPERLDRIDTPRTYRDELPPRALPWPVVLKLLRSIDKKSKAGWRDYAILHLMAHYGLRPSEVAALTLDSVDFEAKLLSVKQRKTRSLLILPLSGSSIRVLRRYLQHGRPVTNQASLFLRARRPMGGIKHYAVCELFEKRARLYGLPAGQYSSYSLRHAFAMRLLQRGTGVKAIGDLLGHRSLESTCVYLRLDVKTLRKVALPVPQLTKNGV